MIRLPHVELTEEVLTVGDRATAGTCGTEFKQLWHGFFLRIPPLKHAIVRGK